MSTLTRILGGTLALALLVSACAPGGDPDDEGPLVLPSPLPATQETAATVTITFGASDYERATFEPLIDSFNQANPDVRVQFVSLDEATSFEGEQLGQPSSYMRRVASAADTASIFFLAGEPVKPAEFHDLSAFIDADPAFNRDDYYPGALDQPGGILYLPRSLRTPLISYNKDLWAAAGLDAPAANWTWSDLIDAATQLTQLQGDQVEVYGLIEDSQATLTLLGELEINGIGLFDAAAPQQLNSPAVAAAVERVVQLVDEGVVYARRPGAAGPADQPDESSLVLERRAGIWVENAAIVNVDSSGLPFEVGTAPFPPINVPFLLGPAEGYVMSSGTLHPEAAWRWLSFLSQQEPTSRGMSLFGYAAPRRSLVEGSSEWSLLSADEQVALLTVLERSAMQPLITWDGGQGLLFTAITTVLQETLAGEDSLKLLAQAQRDVDQQIAILATPPAPTPDLPAIVVATPVPEVAPSGALGLRFGAFGVDPIQTQRIAVEFNNQNPEIFVGVKRPGTATDPYTIGEAAARFDCFSWWGPPATDEFTATLDLQPLLDAESAIPPGDYPAVLLAPFRHDGALRGLPLTVDMPVLAYDRAAFERAGIAPPNESWTVTDLVDAAKRLDNGAAGDQRFYGYASLDTVATDMIAFLDRAGVSLAAGEPAQPGFGAPDVYDALRLYVDLLRSASPHQRVTGLQSNDWSSEGYDIVYSGRAGMWRAFASSASGDPEGPTAVAPLPLGDSPLSANDLSAVGVYISAETEQPEACWQWLKHLSAEVGVLEGRLPARASVAASPEFASVAPPGAADVFRAYVAGLANSNDAGETLASADAMAVELYWLYRAVDRALQGADLEAELAKAQALTEQFQACAAQALDTSLCYQQVDPSYQEMNGP